MVQVLVTKLEHTGMLVVSPKTARKGEHININYDKQLTHLAWLLHCSLLLGPFPSKTVLRIASSSMMPDSKGTIFPGSFNHRDKESSSFRTKGIEDVKCRHAPPIELILFNSQSSSSNDEKPQSISLNKLLIKMYRSSDDRTRQYFQSIGAAIVPVLLQMTDVGLKTELTSDDLALYSLAKSLFRRLLSIDVALVLTRNYHGLVRCLISVTVSGKSENARRNAVHMLAGLSRCVDNKALMATFPGLLDALIDIVAYERSSAVKQEAACVFCELAWEATNKLLMTKKMQCIDAVVKLGEEKNYSSKIYAASTLRLLSAASENKILLVQYKDGLVLDGLLQLLKDILRKQSSLGAANALANLACRQTACRIACHPEMMKTLALLAAQCPLDEIATATASVIKKLAPHISSADNCQTDLFKTFVTMARGTAKGVLLCTAQAMSKHALNPTNRYPMAKYIRLLHVVVGLAMHPDSKIQVSALESLSRIVLNATSAKIIVGRNEIVPLLVEVVVSHLEDKRTQQQAVRDMAVRVVLTIAMHEKTAIRLAKVQGLVASLATYGNSQSSDRQLKNTALRCVILLTPLM